jgi:hypothetical protein
MVAPMPVAHYERLRCFVRGFRTILRGPAPKEGGSCCERVVLLLCYIAEVFGNTRDSKRSWSNVPQRLYS